MFALSRLAFATVIITSERHKNASIRGRAAKESTSLLLAGWIIARRV